MSVKKENDEKTPSTRFDEDFPEIDEETLLPSPDDKAELHDQIATLNEALREAQEKASDYWEKLVRKEADFQNLQKRSGQEIENARKFAIDRLAQELVQVLDNLDHGLTYGQNGQVSVNDLVEGMKLTHSSLMSALERHGITLVEPKVGDLFDPTYHEAIAVQETPELAPNRVIQMVQKGYLLHNRLLRPARVIVSKSPS